jgi:hypothetical protein
MTGGLPEPQTHSGPLSYHGSRTRQTDSRVGFLRVNSRGERADKFMPGAWQADQKCSVSLASLRPRVTLSLVRLTIRK